MTDAEVFAVIGRQAILAALLIVPATTLWFIRDRRWLRGCHLVTRGLVVALFAVLFLVTVPRFKEVLISFGTALPDITVMVIELSDLVVTLLPYLSLLILAGVVSESVLLEMLLEPTHRAYRAKWCSFVVTCGSVFVLLICESAISMAFVKVDDSLQ